MAENELQYDGAQLYMITAQGSWPSLILNFQNILDTLCVNEASIKKEKMGNEYKGKNEEINEISKYDKENN